MPSSTSNFDEEKFERVIPKRAWFKLLVITGILLILFIVIWETYTRHLGFEPSLDDTPDLWSYSRSKVSVDPNQVILIGNSQTQLDFNLNTFYQVSGIKPIQLSSVGVNSLILLDDIANKTEFKGTIILGVDFRLIEGTNTSYDIFSKKILNYYYNWNVSQKIAFYLRFFFDKKIAFIGQEKIQAKNLLNNLKARKKLVDQNFLYYIQELDRQAFMSPRMETDEKYQEQTRNYMLPISIDGIMKLGEPQNQTKSNIIDHFISQLKSSIDKIKSRGGRVVLVQLPLSGNVKILSLNLLPRKNFWNRLVIESGANLHIHFDDYLSLKHFLCPDWVHLNREDSKTFTKSFLEITKNNNFSF